MNFKSGCFHDKKGWVTKKTRVIQLNSLHKPRTLYMQLNTYVGLYYHSSYSVWGSLKARVAERGGGWGEGEPES